MGLMRDLMRQTLSLIFLLPSRFTIDYPSDRGIRRKEFSKLKLIKASLRSAIQRESLKSLTIVSIESEISGGGNLDKVLKDTANAETRKISFP